MTNKLLLAIIILMELAILGAVIYLKFFRWSDDDPWTLLYFLDSPALHEKDCFHSVFSQQLFLSAKKETLFFKWTEREFSAAGEELEICGVDQNLLRFHGSGSWDLHCFIGLLMSLA